MDYNFAEIERKWQAEWAKNKTYKADVDTAKPKYYVLDMFPYPTFWALLGQRREDKALYIGPVLSFPYNSF